MDGLPLLLVRGTQVGPFVQQQLHHLHQFNTDSAASFRRRGGQGAETPTSWNPL